MLPINEYQKIIYNKLIETGYKVFDEVPQDEDLPVVMISDYTLSEGDTKEDDYIFQQKIDVYSQYDGKKEINEMIANVISKMKEAINVTINEEHNIGYIKLLESEVTRLEDGLYVANLVFQINIER